MGENHERSGGHEHGGMGLRGVTRPMAEQAAQEQAAQGGGRQHADSNEHRGGNEHREGDKSHDSSPHDESEHDQHSRAGREHHMSRDDRLQMLEHHHANTLWIYWTLVPLGVWLCVAPFSFGYLNPDLWVDPSGGRGVWFSDATHPELRAWLVTASDIVGGLLLLVFGWRSLTPNRPKSLWTCCFVGVWLTFAPVLLWAPTAGAFVNDTVVGVLLIALTILIPGMPNMMMYMQHGPPTPPGWSYNPSSWPQRWIMIVTGFAGWIVSRYLAAFQLGYITSVWDPFFGFSEGTRQVLNSKMSHMWPISDGGLGSISYTFEFLMGYMGSPARWRTMPWMVAFFGFLVIPLGLTHILLVGSQPVVVGHWCSMCLLAALIMLPMIPLEVDEVVAMGQHMIEAKRRGDRGGSLWRIFWKGGRADGCTPDARSPMLITLPQKPWSIFLASIWGMSFPWTLAVSAMLGVWLMAAPSVLGSEGGAADVDHLGGVLIVTTSVICMGEVIRAGRFLNVPLGLAVAACSWTFSGASFASGVSSTIAGLTVAALAVPRGSKIERYGLWDRYVF